jgi:hypothetical protein
LVRLSRLNFVQFVLNFSFEKHDHDHDGDDVHEQDQPRACRPLLEHVGSSNWGANIDVNIAPGLSNAAKAGSFLHQPIVKAWREFFGKRDFTEDEADHAGAAGAGGAVCRESDATGFGMLNDGFTWVDGALTQKMRSS